MNQYIELLEKPFLKSGEIAKLLDVAPSTVTKMTKKYEMTKYPWGYSTDELIEKIGWLKKYIRRNKN